jgi:heme-degrading monooxygenase HmoA
MICLNRSPSAWKPAGGHTRDYDVMILEIAPLSIRAGQLPAFEAAFLRAQRIIASMPGYRAHELRRCLERPDEYVLLVRWDSLEAHEVGFRTSPQYQEWSRLLHHFYDPFPIVSHYDSVPGASGP